MYNTAMTRITDTVWIIAERTDGIKGVIYWLRDELKFLAVTEEGAVRTTDPAEAWDFMKRAA